MKRKVSSRALAQQHSDEAISIMLKNKLATMIEKTKDASTVVALTNAFAKLRAVEHKIDEGDYGEDLPQAEAAPPPDLGVRQ